MGRGKIEIKRIENSSNRHVTYSKRRNGIMKKVKEITVLCDAHVSLVIFASSGKMHEYCSPSTTLINMLERYHKASGKKLWDAKHENLSKEIDRIKKENENMQIELRHLKGEDITSLQYKELIAIEEALEIGLSNIRNKQMEFFKMMKRNEQILEEENQELMNVLHQQELAAMDGIVREGQGGYHQRVREYQPHMPFAFRVQPIQPNLQDRI
uniref:PISTILLATA-like protein 2 n=1 Tax=Ilex verticillata TaxID=185559 RepID=A0A9E8M493_ILEVE|nr:PISTILLATA-like protein 2 [Ilex verticillata]